jgi:hypothetical protein
VLRAWCTLPLLKTSRFGDAKPIIPPRKYAALALSPRDDVAFPTPNMMTYKEASRIPQTYGGFNPRIAEPQAYTLPNTLVGSCRNCTELCNMFHARSGLSVDGIHLDA